MALNSLIQAFRAYVMVPGIWLSGIVSCIGILLAYLAYTLGGFVPAFLVLLLLILVIPFFFAGTYGVILDSNRKKGAFIVYGAYGYFKTLLPWLFLLLITFVIVEALAYFLLVAGLSYTWVMIICCLIVVPVIFYCYFADISAIRHNLRTWQAIKASALTVRSASFSIIAFYLIHILLILFIVPLIMELMFSLFGGAEVLTAGLTEILNNYGITDLTSIDSEALLNNMSEMSMDSIETMTTSFIDVLLSTEVVRALFFSCAFTSLLFMPFLVAYKTYYYQKIMKGFVVKVQQAAANSHSTEEDGEYDEKGRWFKYK